MKLFLQIAICILAVFGILTLFACENLPSSQTAYAFSVNGTDAVPGADASPVLAAAGSYLQFSESGSCGGFEGTDKVYTYNGYRIYTTPAENGDVISKIELTSDAVSTKEGIKVGAATAQIISAYGESTKPDAYVYTAGNTVLQFTVRDGAVVGIVYTCK